MHSDNEVRSRVVELTKALIRIPSENPPGDQKGPCILDESGQKGFMHREEDQPHLRQSR